jgi:hypothetical protein
MAIMHLTRVVRVASLVTAVLAITQITANAASTPDAFQVRVSVIAEHLTHFATRAVISNRPLMEMEIPSQVLAEQAQLLADLKSLSHAPDELHRLLRDPDPKVRTIALGALFVREDSHDLPYIASLIGDHASAIPDLHNSMRAMAPFVPKLDSKLESPQTVGQVASAMIQFYLEAAHTQLADHSNGHPISESDLSPEFDRYWTERKDRAHCASWFLVKLERATRQTSAVPAQYWGEVDAVLAQITALPSPDREWTFLYALFGASGPPSKDVVPDAALVYVARAIGPVDLLKFLLLEPFSTDPDLRFTQADPRNEVFFPIATFILDHAPRLLRPGDAPLIRAHAFNNPQHNQGSSSLWIAASDWLTGIENPTKGAAQLKADLALFPSSSAPWSQREQMPLAVDLWRLRGAGEKKFLVDWFYGLSPKEEPSLGQEFLRAVGADARPDISELLAEIVADSRFDNTNWSVLAQLLELAGGGWSVPLIPTTEIYSYMPNRFRSDEAEAFASWRNVLRRCYGLPEHPRPNTQ